VKRMRNATGEVGGMFKKMFHYFQFKKVDFRAHYHHRSNVESTVMMIKTKFGDSLRSKSDTAMKNEVLAKALCHNILLLDFRHVRAWDRIGTLHNERRACTTERPNIIPLCTACKMDAS
jgi:transposase